MTNPVTDPAEEEKLKKMFLGLRELSKRKRKRMLLTLGSIALIAVVALLFRYVDVHYLSHYFPSDNYAPTDTVIDLSPHAISLICLAIGIILVGAFLVIREPVILFIIPLVIICVRSDGLNILMHLMNDLDDRGYKNIQILVKNQPNLLLVLPNYVNEKCEMTLDNYNHFTTLTNDPYSDIFIAKLPRPKTVDEIKKMCSLTIFRD